jgi:predicted exporter/predicted hotdog family 3-hydroxylacyl-ACP dehydratase
MKELSSGARASLLALWIAALALLGFFVQRQLEIGTDLRLFLPNPTTPQERLLLEEIGEGPGSRVLVLALGGAPPEKLADASRALAAELTDHSLFRFVANGEMSLDDVPEHLLRYRHLLSRKLDTHTFDAEYLRSEIQARARDLASPAGTFLEPWVPVDPTLELLAVLQDWQPAQEPNRLYDVWFDRAGERALLLAETQAAAFDPDKQRAAIEVVHEALARIDPKRRLSIVVSGAGQFSVLMEQRTRGEAQMLGTAASVGMVLLLLIAYRRTSSVLFSALPLATAALAGLAVVSALFGTVHGITLAFGFTLIGVVQDYPVHLLSHRRPDQSALLVVRQLWPTLATGVASTCIAYLTFLFSGVTGLQQLACFTIAGLATASLTTRFALPRLMSNSSRDYGESSWLQSLWKRIDSLPRVSWTPLALIVASLLAIGVSRSPLWEDDLGKLTPVPVELIEQDQALRGSLGTADLGYLLVVDAPDTERALQRLEGLGEPLEQLVSSGAIAGFDHAARYLPSVATQVARQRKLPDDPTLRAALEAAQQGSGFRAKVFEPFLRDVSEARSLPPLTPDTLRDSPLGANLEMMLVEGEGQTRALVTLSGVRDAGALSKFVSEHEHVLILDLKQASETLVAKQRTHILWSLCAAVVLLVAVIAFALRSRLRLYRVLAPMALTTLIIIAALQLAGISLSLFHLIALMLAAGLGLDYALFFEHAADDPLEQRRTLHAVLVCSLSTLMVFALLALSTIPVLRAIGLTVTLGVVSNFVLAVMMSRMATGDGRRATGQNKEGTPGTGDAAGQSVGESSQRHRGSLSASISGQLAVASSPFPSSLMPHQGSMCLLERVIDWDEDGIRLTTATHRSTENPLRSEGRLRSIHLCEYGAQAMAVHGALRSQAQNKKPAPGMLVSLRSVTFSRDYIEDLGGELIVDAQCLQASEMSLQYNFRVTHEQVVLAEGRAAVVLQAEA